MTVVVKKLRRGSVRSKAITDHTSVGAHRFPVNFPESTCGLWVALFDAWQDGSTFARSRRGSILML